MDIGNLKHLFFFLDVLQIPVKECHEYDGETEMLTT